MSGSFWGVCVSDQRACASSLCGAVIAQPSMRDQSRYAAAPPGIAQARQFALLSSSCLIFVFPFSRLLCMQLRIGPANRLEGGAEMAVRKID